MSTERAYCLPGEYCIFYRHPVNLAAADIGKRALDKFREVTDKVVALYPEKKYIPLIDQLRNNVLTVRSVYTITTRKGNQDDYSLSLVVVEIPPPAPFADWEELYLAIEGKGRGNNPPRSTPIPPALIYRDCRLEVVKSIVDLYRPREVYRNAIEGTLLDGRINSAYYSEQRQSIIDVLADSTQTEGIESVSPHWRVAPSPNDGPPPLDSGGPGSRPKDTTSSINPHFVPYRDSSSVAPSRNPNTIWWETETGNLDVHVVVLDSVHLPDRINGAFSESSGLSTQLLKDLLGGRMLEPRTDIPSLSDEVGDVWYNSESKKLHVIYKGNGTEDQWKYMLPDPLPPENRRPASVQGHDYKMPDHGVFISGIIRSIAPSARIYLVEALNAYGVGNIESVWGGFLKFWNYFHLLHQPQGKTQEVEIQEALKEARIVFNCSLGFDTPPLFDLKTLEQTQLDSDVDKCAYARFYQKLAVDLENDALFNSYLNFADKRRSPASATPTPSRDPEAQHRFMAEMWPSFEGMRKLFSRDFFDLWRSDVPNGLIAKMSDWGDGTRDDNYRVIIAAAGNGRREGDVHPTAFFPASDIRVVGVGALQLPDDPAIPPTKDQEKIAEYSNIADAPPDTGYYVFGGVGAAQPADETRSSPVTQTDGGIVGIYLGNFPPASNTSSTPTPMPTEAPRPTATFTPSPTPLPTATGTPSTNGLGEWAGTSFATPIIAGIVAELLHRGVSMPLNMVLNNAGETEKTEGDVSYAPTVENPCGDKLKMRVVQVKQIR